MSSFSIQVGAGATGAAYFFLDFSSGPSFATGVKTTPPTIDLNTDIIGIGNGASGCATSLPFTAASQTNSASGTNITELKVFYSNAASHLKDGTNERLVVAGASPATSIPLSFSSNSTSSITVGSVTYNVKKLKGTTVDTISFTSSATFTIAETEILLDALAYDNESTFPASGKRSFEVNIRNTRFLSPTATFIATIGCVSISGNIYHDANGLKDLIVNGNGTMGQFAAAGAYAVLTGASGTVLQTKPIVAGGAYNFGRVDPGVYNIYISNTATPPATVTAAAYPAGNYISTGENLGAAAGKDKLTDGKLGVTVGSVAVTNANLGVQIPPAAADSLFANQQNPGGFNYFTIPAGGFKISDADGTVDSLIITAFPQNANYLKVGSTVYISTGTCPPQSVCTAWPGELRLPASAAGTISVDPSLPGNTTVTLNYLVIDNGNAKSNNGVPSVITLPFTIPATPITISGNVWNDNDGDGNKAASEVYTAAASSGQALYAILVQNTKTYEGVPTVYATAQITAAATGYTFSGIPTGNDYEVRIASLASSAVPVQGSAFSLVIPSLATNYAGVSTNNNGNIVQKLNTNNLLNSLGVLTASLTNINFGIEQIPTAENKSFTAPAVSFGSGGAVMINGSGSKSINGNSSSLTGSALRSLSGSDPEDCAVASSCNTTKTYRIQTIKSNTKLYYNFGAGSVLVNTGTDIPNFNPANLTIYGQVGQGFTVPTALGFTYSLIDAAGLISPAATYTLMTTGSALPVKLVSFTGTVSKCTATLNWESSYENGSRLYAVEQSTDGVKYEQVAAVPSTNAANGSKYNAYVNMQNAAQYYRLKIIDANGSFSYSDVLPLRSAGCEKAQVTISPNPATDIVRIGGLTSASSVVIYDNAGKALITLKNVTNNQLIDVTSLPAGTYILKATDNQNEITNIKLIRL